jgi:hypothetical protein
MRFAYIVATALCLATADPALALEDVIEEEESSSSSSSSGPRGGRFGIGIVLGDPSALTAKLFLSSSSAVQMHLGYALTRHDRLVVIVDYLFHVLGVIPPIERAGKLVPYVGVGGRLGVAESDDALLGIRIPLGLAFHFNGVPLEIFLEVAPGLGILPRTRALVDAGLGVRFYF